jgi:hypothetical protein
LLVVGIATVGPELFSDQAFELSAVFELGPRTLEIWKNVPIGCLSGGSGEESEQSREQSGGDLGFGEHGYYLLSDCDNHSHDDDHIFQDARTRDVDRPSWI